MPMKLTGGHGQHSDVFYSTHMGSGVGSIQITRFKLGEKLFVFHGQVDSDLALFYDKNQIMVMAGSINQLPLTVTHGNKIITELLVLRIL